MALIYSELKKAQIELLATDPTDAAEQVLGRVIYNTTDGVLRVWSGSAWVTIADEFSAGKTFNIASITSVDSPYTLDFATDLLLVDASGGAITVNLPSAAGQTGQTFIVKALDVTNDITLDPNGAETIDGEATVVLNGENSLIQVSSDNTNYQSTGTAPNLIQTKTLNSNAQVDGVMSDLTFSNLRIGKWYEICGQFEVFLDTGAPNPQVFLNVIHNSSTIATLNVLLSETSDSSVDRLNQDMSFKFKAEATSVTFNLGSASTTSYIAGNGQRNATFVQIEERNDLRETSQF